MNLFEMWRHRDPNLVLSNSVRESKGTIEGEVWRGFHILPDSVPQIRLRGAPGWFPFRQRPEFVGWMARTLGNGLLKVWFAPAGEPDCQLGTPYTLQLNDRLLSVRIPWPFDVGPLPLDAELVLHAPLTNESAVFLGVHRQLERRELLRLAKGHGAELGPGHQPQVLPGPDVDVVYVEQMPPEDWIKLYDPKGQRSVDKSLWNFYRIGSASSLPVPDETLDFVFSSHVFEHLANPFGHLVHWHKKLKPEGLILAVVPDVGGWKDYAFHPSRLTDLLDEYQSGSMEPALSHYERWVRGRQLKMDPAEMLASGRSIHVHFYTHSNMAELLQWAVDHLGFQYFHLRHTPNAKDFYFVLAKSPKPQVEAPTFAAQGGLK